MAWDISYKVGETGGFQSAQTRDEAIAVCCDLLARGAELHFIKNADKKSKETLTIDEVQRYAEALRRRQD
jgi:hypothetical protein